jgi:glycosyltransferase involved in cell wall biosynthesis
MWKGQSVSVIFPCYNEEKGIIKAINDFFSTGYVDEIVVVDNNSTDKSAELVRPTKAKLVSEIRQGYGFALIRGLSEATGDLIVMTEPDGTFLAKDINKLLAYSDDFDIVLGSRTRQEMIHPEANMDFFMKNGNRAVAKLLEFLFRTTSLSDCGCTMRLLNRNTLQAILPYFTVGTLHFLPEMIILGQYLGANMIEIPLNYCARIGESKITGNTKITAKVALKMIAIIVGYRFKIWFGLAPKLRLTGEK